MTRDPQVQAKRDRADLMTAVVVAALAVAALVYDSVARISALFATPGAITVAAPFDAQTVTVDVGGGSTTAMITSGTLVVEDVSVISVVSLVAAIVTGSAGLIAAAVLASAVCRRLLRGHIFDRINVILTFWVSLSLLIGSLGAVWFQNMGLNGVLAATGGEFDGQAELMLQAVPFFVAAMAAGVLVIVFRRGAELQRDAEGLV
ncbi:hypothetical protein [Microbacterium sp.]|uniref:hypothetical protein n=1 Tax=Microbacterium sp. TaxID=51671 RepID=UPI00281144B1|nr:hypothetical protein [Microbacterium sp.]